MKNCNTCMAKEKLNAINRNAEPRKTYTSKANASQQRALFKAEQPKKCMHTEFCKEKNKRLSHALTQVFVFGKAKCKQTLQMPQINWCLHARTQMKWRKTERKKEMYEQPSIPTSMQSAHSADSVGWLKGYHDVSRMQNLIEKNPRISTSTKVHENQINLQNWYLCQVR